MFKKLAQQLKLNRKNENSMSTNPFFDEFSAPKSVFLQNLSKRALELYERQTDINNFSKLVLSNPENNSHEKMVNELFDSGVVDPLEDEKLETLSNNKKFLEDLGLL